MSTQWPTTEQLLKLAKEDPAALEALRQREIEALISSASPDIQRRLRGLQFQIDAKRQVSKNPMAACVAISRMMFDSVYELNDALTGKTTELAAKPAASHTTNNGTTNNHPRTQASKNQHGKILAFPMVSGV